MYKKLPEYLSYKKDELHYEGINLLDLTATYGSPLEVAYTNMINKKIMYLKGIFTAAIEKNKYQGNYFFTYATKANYYSEVISTSLNHTDYLETSSGYDLDIIEKLFNDKLIPAGFTIICNGFKKGYYFDKIVCLQQKGLNIIPVIENNEEAEMFLNQEQSFDIGMRINIDEQRVSTFLDGNRAGSAVDSRFGIYFEEMMTLAQKFHHSPHLKFKLFHFHMGGTIYDINRYVKFISYLFEKNYCVLKKISPDLEYFDIGGGFPTQYNLDFKFDYKKLVEEIIYSIKRIADRYKITHPHIIGEHGRYTVADHSFFLYEISIVKKSNQNSYWYLINSSLMNYLPDSWALGQDFVILPLNLIGNRMVKVKLGGLTCDPDDTYYKQHKNNFLYLPEIKAGETLFIGVFGTGAYQEMIAGVGGVHHCMIPEGNELIIRKKGKHHQYNSITHAQSANQLLDILDYQNTHNLMQYLDSYNIHLEEHEGELETYFKLLKNDYPEKEIFPYKNMEAAYRGKKLKLILIYSDHVLIGYAFLTVLDESNMVVINYLAILPEYRSKGYGHIFINELKSRYADSGGILVEIEKPFEEKSISSKHRQAKFYEDLSFIKQNYAYKILTTGSESFLPMLLYVCNLKNTHDYVYGYAEMTAILDEYYQIFFSSNFKAQYQLEQVG
jgi:arginine decarboxylase